MSTSEARKILFYELRLYDATAATKRKPVLADPAFTLIKALPALDPATNPGKPTRYMDWKSDSLLMEIFSMSPTQVKGAFAIKRTRGLPRVESAGKWSNLRLQAGQGLAEIRHFVYWRKEKVVGIEVNGRGPGMGAFGDYLCEKAGEKPTSVGAVEFSIYLADDQFDVLAASSKVSTATIGVRRGSISAVSALDQNIHDSLAALAKSSNAQELRVDLVLGDRRRDASLNIPFMSKLKGFVANPTQRDALTELKARAKDPDLGEMRTIDLLEDRFVGREEVVISTDGVVDQKSMLRAIEKASSDVLTTTN